MRLVALVAVWILGLLMGLELDVPMLALAFISVAALILAYLFMRTGFSPLPPLLLLVILLGLARVEVSEGQPLRGSDDLQPVTVRGLIVDDPEISGRGVELTVSVEEVDRGTGWDEADGRILVLARPPRQLVRTREEPYFRYGDRLELIGRMEEPPVLGNFDYGAYLAAQGVHSRMSFPGVRFLDGGGGNRAQGFLYDLRRTVSDGIDRALPESQASLAKAMLLGLRGPLPKDITEDFRSTGTSHLLAISGLHVGVLLALSLAAGAWLMGRRRQLYLQLPLGVIWLYALLSGLSPSVERAAIMGSVYLFALALGRPRSALPALAFAAGVMASFEPLLLKQVSFQLSFTAVAGIALVSTSEWPLWSRFVVLPAGGSRWRSFLWRSLALAVAVSVAATVATLPLIAFNFQRIPTVGIPATVLALPTIPFLVFTTAVAAVAGMVSTSVGQVQRLARLGPVGVRTAACPRPFQSARKHFFRPGLQWHSGMVLLRSTGTAVVDSWRPENFVAQTPQDRWERPRSCRARERARHHTTLSCGALPGSGGRPGLSGNRSLVSVRHRNGRQAPRTFSGRRPGRQHTYSDTRGRASAGRWGPPGHGRGTGRRRQTAILG